MSLQWDGGAIKALEEKHKKNLQKAAIYLTGQCRINCNRPQDYQRVKGAAGVWYRGLDPSAPGEYPKRVIGDLVRSIANEPSLDGNTWRVGTARIVGLYLEFGTSKMAPRPWLSTTLTTEHDNILKILST